MYYKNNNIDICIQKIEHNRIGASQEVEFTKQKLFEQYFTPLDIVEYMVKLFTNIDNVKILDAGAGVGNLGAIAAMKYLSKSVDVQLTSIEWDKNLLYYLSVNLASVKNEFSNFQYKIINDSFYNFALELDEGIKYNRIIINPPYTKTSLSDNEYNVLKKLNVKTPNAYTNFIEICINLLDEGGELVAIVPRSFCNGTRFTKFRNNLINNVKIEFIHLFKSRQKVFKEYGVLQEIIIIKLTKRNIRSISISISDKLIKNKIDKFPYNKIIFDNDPYKFIHIPDKETDEVTLTKIYSLPSSLKELGLNISTGKVVEYREVNLIKDNINNPEAAFVIYQNYINNNIINLNLELDKYLFLNINKRSKHKVLEKGNYIVIKRMSYKENTKRISSALIRNSDFKYKYIAIENHLNYIHMNGKGIEKYLVVGLNTFLNTKTLDNYIRRFSGHTQINASDILSLPMPDLDTLVRIGKKVNLGRITELEIEKLIFKG